jgi:Arrestin (or S-antigen), N-terminal domain
VYVYYNLHRSTKVIPLGCAGLSPGIHEYPFTFMVPRNLPPSLKAPLGAVNHRLRARVKRVGHVPNLLYRMTGGAATSKIPLIVHNSDHTSPHDETFRPSSQDDPPAYSSNRRQWSGQRRNGQIDWSLQGPTSVHISHRIDILAKLRIAKGYGAVDSATVDLVQVEKYQAEPDPTVWTFPIEQMTDEEEGASGSDDGFPETRTTGVRLKQAAALAPFGTGLNSHCREKVRLRIQELYSNNSGLNLSNRSQRRFLLHLIQARIILDIYSI